MTAPPALPSIQWIRCRRPDRGHPDSLARHRHGLASLRIHLASRESAVPCDDALFPGRVIAHAGHRIGADDSVYARRVCICAACGTAWSTFSRAAACPVRWRSRILRPGYDPPSSPAWPSYQGFGRDWGWSIALVHKTTSLLACSAHPPRMRDNGGGNAAIVGKPSSFRFAFVSEITPYDGSLGGVSDYIT